MTTTERLNLPYLAVAQAQKEMTHNEALVLLDVAVQPVVQSIAPANVPAAPALGQCWIVGESPVGDWAGHEGALAAWTPGGWRFVAPFEGMSAWSISDGVGARRTGGAWIVGQATATKLSIGGQQVVGARHSAIPVPTGGTIVDVEARAAVFAMIQTMTSHGLIS